MEFDSCAQRRDSSRGGRHSLARDSVVLQPSGFRRRPGRHGGLAHPRPTRPAESLGVPLACRCCKNGTRVKIVSWRARALIEFGFVLYRLWARTLRLEVEDPNNVVAFVRTQPVSFAIWHNR